MYCIISAAFQQLVLKQGVHVTRSCLFTNATPHIGHITNKHDARSFGIHLKSVLKVNYNALLGCIIYVSDSVGITTVLFGPLVPQKWLCSDCCIYSLTTAT